MPPSTENEVAEEIRLLAAIAAGDRPAFRQLYARYGSTLFPLAIRLVGDPGMAEEALQDTFVKIWRHAAAFDARKSRPFTWAVTILRRTCIDHLRKHRRDRHAVPLPADDLLPVELFSPESIRRTTELNEATALLQTTLATVSPPQRTALELALFSTLTHAEIGVRLAQPVGTIKTWIRRGLLDLRAALTDPTS